MEHYDVVIVGAGPAGSACAKALKEDDRKVLVIEKEPLPRHKTCSGILFGQTQVLLKEYFGKLPPDEMYCDPNIVKASDIHEWSAEKGFFPYMWELPKDGQEFPQDYYNVWRNAFDLWLLQESDAEYRDTCALRNLSVTDDGITIDVAHKEQGTEQISCTYLVGADGSHSRVRMIIDIDWAQTATTIGIYQTYLRFASMGKLLDAHWYVFFDKELGDILSCCHRKDDVLTLCVGGLKGRHLKQGMEKFKAFLSKECDVVFEKMVRDEGCIIRLGPPLLGSGNVLLAGEAAGFIYLNGEGISAALDSGYQAGKAIAQAIKEGGNATEIYTKRSEGILKHFAACREQMHFLVE